MGEHTSGIIKNQLSSFNANTFKMGHGKSLPLDLNISFKVKHFDLLIICHEVADLLVMLNLFGQLVLKQSAPLNIQV